MVQRSPAEREEEHKVGQQQHKLTNHLQEQVAEGIQKGAEGNSGSDATRSKGMKQEETGGERKAPQQHELRDHLRGTIEENAQKFQNNVQEKSGIRREGTNETMEEVTAGSETKAPVQASSFLVDFALGGMSGAFAKTCTAPIERVKLLIQTQDSNPRIRSGEIPRYTGIVNCFTRVYAEQGLAAFWRGNLVNITRYFPTQAFNFAFKDSIKKLFPKADSKTEFGKCFLINVASGGLAGAGSLCFVYPLDYARTRLASDVGTERVFTGLWDCLKKTASGPKGPIALYNGFGVSVIGIIPYRGVYFGLYDSFSAKNPYRDDKGFKGAGSKFAIAQAVAITAGYASYPFDTVRRRLQMQSEKPKEQWLYSGPVDCVKKVMAEEGSGALFKGATSNVLRTVGSALVLVLYDQLKTVFDL